MAVLEQKLLLTHFSPKRTACVELDYANEIENDRVYLSGTGRLDRTDEINDLSFKDLAYLAYGYGLEKPPAIDFKQFVLDRVQSD